MHNNPLINALSTHALIRTEPGSIVSSEGEISVSKTGFSGPQWHMSLHIGDIYWLSSGQLQLRPGLTWMGIIFFNHAASLHFSNVTAPNRFIDVAVLLKKNKGALVRMLGASLVTDCWKQYWLILITIH